MRAAVVTTALLIAMTFAAGAQAAAPSPVIEGPGTASTAAFVGFDASKSSDADGQPLRFRWEIDGQPLDVDDPWLAVTFSHAGRHVVSVIATDSSGASARADHEVLVTGQDRSDAAVSPLGSMIFPTARAFPELVVRPLRVRVSRNNLRLELRCRGRAVCHGTLRAVTLVGPGPVERPLLLAHRRFSILRGGPRIVHMHLRRQARRRLAAHRRVRVTAYRGSVRVAHIWATYAYRAR